MAAATTDKVSRVSTGVRPVSTTVSTIRNAAATTLACADLTGWTTTEKVHFVTYQIDGQGAVVAGSQCDWTGLVSGSNINSLVLTGGTDAGNSAGDIVEILPTAQYAKDLADNILTHADQDGTLTAGAVDNAAVLASNVVTTAKILDANITTAKVADDAITDAKLVSGKIRSRQGGSATDWSTTGTTTYDYSATNTLILCGTIAANASPKTITFPTAFSQVPLVVATVSSVASNNAFARIATVTATTVQIQVINHDGTASTAENVNWIAMGK